MGNTISTLLGWIVLRRLWIETVTPFRLPRSGEALVDAHDPQPEEMLLGG